MTSKLEEMFLFMVGSDEWLQEGRMIAIKNYLRHHNIPSVHKVYEECLETLKDTDKDTYNKLMVIMEG